MNGLMRRFDYKRYFDQFRTMPEPIMMSELPKVKLNLKGIREYAKNKGVAMASLSKEEKQLYIKKDLRGKDMFGKVLITTGFDFDEFSINRYIGVS